MIRYEVDEQGIFRVWFEGLISFKDISEYLQEFDKINNLPNNMRLLYDFTKGKINIVEEDLATVSDMALEVTRKFNSVRTAFLVSAPDVMAFTILFSQLKESERHKRYVFSKYDAAVNWLITSSK